MVFGSNRGLGYVVMVVIAVVAVIVAVIGSGSSSSSSSSSSNSSSSGSTWFLSVWLAEVRLTVPPLYDKHALVISIIEVECVMVTITIRGGLLVDRLRGGSGGGGYLRRKW